MWHSGSGKVLLQKLLDAWEEFLTRLEPESEVAFRLQRLQHLLAPLADRLFLKTLKGQEILHQCYAQTQALQALARQPGADFYRLLTALEDLVLELQRQTQEFRVKAG